MLFPSLECYSLLSPTFRPQLKYHFLGEVFSRLLTKSNPPDPLSHSNSPSFITPVMMETLRLFVYDYLNVGLPPKIS